MTVYRDTPVMTNSRIEYHLKANSKLHTLQMTACRIALCPPKEKLNMTLNPIAICRQMMHAKKHLS